MPFKSEDQRKAMYAAAKGKSTIGIPKSVGEKFIEHKDDAAGVLHHKNGIGHSQADTLFPVNPPMRLRLEKHGKK